MALTSRLFCLVLATLSTVNSVYGTQVMHRPAGYKNPPNHVKTNLTPDVHHIEKRATGKVSMAYFTNWGIYPSYNFQPTDIIPSELTHILYAFADVSADSGTISLTDSNADTDKHYPGDSWNDSGTNLYGCLKQMYLLKLANRNLKVLLSIGGWTYSQANHFNFVTSASSRATFVSSAVSMIETYGFDGIDLDFEYPSTPEQGQGFANLFTELRTAFDKLASQKGDSQPYQLTAAVSAGAANYANLVVPQMDKALTYWNLMAYDYAGSWLNYTDNMANLYGGVRTNVSTDAAVKHFVSAGATIGKINMGIPLYGRAFENTKGLGQAYNGIGPGTVEAGVYSYKFLPISGAQVFENTTDVTSYSYDSSKQEFVSYDTPDIVKLKAQYVNSKGMAGTMFWELSGDKSGSDSLIQTSKNVLGTLDQTQNHISYPNSKYDNIRSNMGTTGSTSTTTSTGSTPTGGSTCSTASAWSATSVYTGGQSVTYKGHLYQAKWWTQGETPGVADVWADQGACQNN